MNIRFLASEHYSSFLQCDSKDKHARAVMKHARVIDCVATVKIMRLHQSTLSPERQVHRGWQFLV